ncbi:hypothetical protein AB4P17_09910 [Escherichia coli]|uniref:hypothetical protein n=1 Tax=Escherichia coli TaxID=562 RepID=UPI0034C5D6B2
MTLSELVNEIHAVTWRAVVAESFGRVEIYVPERRRLEVRSRVIKLIPANIYFNVLALKNPLKMKKGIHTFYHPCFLNYEDLRIVDE